jgi:hypothetical protein
MTAPQLNAAIQGQGTISADNLNTYVQTAQNSAQLRDFTGVINQVVQLQGITLPNDGTGGWFYWNPSGTEPDDDFNYIVPSGSGSGEWVRLTFAVSNESGVFNTLIVTGLTTLKSDVIIRGILSESIATGLVGAGSTQGTATRLTANLNIANSVASGTGFILPTMTPSGNLIQNGTQITLLNRGTNIASLYPPSGQMVGGLSVNTPSGIAVNGGATAIYAGAGQWWIN